MRLEGQRGVRSVIAAIALATAALASLGAGSSVGGQARSLSSAEAVSASARVVAVQGDIAQTGLVDRIEAALGGAFGGAWFDADRAQMHIGVVSAGDRRTVEALAARAGLGDVVTETRVRSTRDELVAAQEELGERLGDLFEQGQVKTAILPDRNTVLVELGSAVLRSRRSAVEREAGEAGVGVAVVVAPTPEVGFTPQARCNEFFPTQAYCDPTIAAGVSILSSTPEAQCTAGPAVILQKPAKKPQTTTEATETFVLTAGHCLRAGGVTWSAFNKAEKPQPIGPGIAYRVEGVDVGVIRVTNPTITKSKTGYWAVKGLAPVAPSVVSWEEKEPEPVAVTSQWEPKLGEETCLSGQTTGTQCGEIVAENVKAKDEETGAIIEELLEVTGVATAEGDSGGPWWAFGRPDLVGGTHVGRDKKSGNALFQSLKSSFSTLSIKLELLTTANEKRHPFKFKSEGSAVLTGEQDGEADALGFGAGTISCKKTSYSGETLGTESGEITLTPSYSECTRSGIGATIDVNGCTYVFKPAEGESESSFEGSFNISCPEGNELTVTTTGCKITVGEQTDLGTVTYTNNGSGSTRKVTADLNLSGIEYEEHNVAPFSNCASNTVAKSNGTYKGRAQIKGEVGESPKGIWVE